MEQNPELGEELREAIRTQIETENPSITGQTLTRLLDEGYTKKEAIELMACVLIEDIHEMMIQDRLFDIEIYTKKMNKLPELDLDEIKE